MGFIVFFSLSLVWKQIFKLMIYSVGKKCKKFDPLGTFWFVNMLTEFLMLFGMEVLPNFVFTRFQILAVKIEHLKWTEKTNHILKMISLYNEKRKIYALATKKSLVRFGPGKIYVFQ
jgi:hypothetical protein